MGVYQCSLINDLRGGDHHKRTTTLGGVSHDERCLEAADEIARLRAALADIIPTNRLHGLTPSSAGKQVWFDGPSASIARAALEAAP